jgi:pimeloyl-ACP methyl ester carboxylesterase
MKRILKKTVMKKGDCALPYWTNSEGEGPWIVMLHGPCVDHRSFDPLLSELKESKVLLCDFRGHGNSEGNTEKITMDLLEEDVLDILDHAGIKQAVFIGQSTGGAIVQKIAKHHPEMVLGMGLLGIACINSRITPFEAGASVIMGAILKRYKIERMASNTSRSYSTTIKGREYVRKSVLKMPKEALLEIVGGSVNWMEKDKKYKTQIPAFVAVGSGDALSMTKRTFQVYRKTMPQADLYKLMGGATLLQFDLPKQINELVERLLLKIYNTEEYDRAMMDYRKKYEEVKSRHLAEREKQEEKGRENSLKNRITGLLSFNKNKEGSKGEG